MKKFVFSAPGTKNHGEDKRFSNIRFKDSFISSSG